MTTENKELYNQVLEYFKSNNITIPQNILTCIDQAFDEFEFIDEDNSVNLYFKEDAETFENDLTITNANNININGMSSGVYTATYTYTDNVDYIVNEKTDLMFDNEVIETTVDIMSTERSVMESESDWVIVVAETISYGDGDFTRIPRLYIYSPVSGEGIE